MSFGRVIPLVKHMLNIFCIGRISVNPPSLIASITISSSPGALLFLMSAIALATSSSDTYVWDVFRSNILDCWYSLAIEKFFILLIQFRVELFRNFQYFISICRNVSILVCKRNMFCVVFFLTSLLIVFEISLFNSLSFAEFIMCFYLQDFL